MNNKKGIAPVISTIVLLLFATGLGIVVMNWGAQVSSAKEQTTESSINFIEINGEKDVCIKEGVIYFTLENSGETNIESLKISFIGDSVFQKKIDYGLDVGDIKKINVEYEDIGELLKVKIVPSGGGKIWTKKGISIENIKAC